MTSTVATLARVWQLRELSQEALAALAAASNVETYAKDTVVIAQGDIGEDAFVVVTGRLEVLVDGRRGPVPVAVVGPGEMVGELAVLDSSHVRSATVMTLAPSQLVRVDGIALAAAIAQTPVLRAELEATSHRMAIGRFIKAATLLSELPPDALADIAARVRVRNVAAGDTAIVQGEPGFEAFLVRSGELEVLVASDGGADRNLARLRPGMLFGEAALLTGAPRNATVRALTPVELLVLDREDLVDAMAAAGGVAEQLIGMLHARSRPARRDGIELHERQTTDGSTIGILKDRANGRYFWLSPEAMFLWERLDGRRTIRDLTLDLLTERHVLAPDLVMDSLQRLASAGFIDVARVDAGVDRALERGRVVRRLSATVEWAHKIEHVDDFFAALFHWLRPAYSTAGGIAAFAISVAGFAAFLALAPSVAGSLLHGGMFARAGVALLPLIAVAVVMHEIGHGVAAKAAGSNVTRIEIGWSWLRPVFSVDTSDAWLASRSRRMLVDSGGLIVNVVLAALAALVAFAAPRQSSTMVLAWIFALWSYIGVLRNLNPLVEFDGYYLLMDWLEKPNLRQKSLAWLGTELPRALREPEQLRKHRIELVYGIGALCYIVVLTIWGTFVYHFTIGGWVERVVHGANGHKATLIVAAGIALVSLLRLGNDILRERTVVSHAHARRSAARRT